jgi:hypothetical protein
MTLPSEWADQNPLALREGLDRSIRQAWRHMHQLRRERDVAAASGLDMAAALASAGASAEEWALVTLLDIRKGSA